jgi:hypothetical protein
VLIYFILLYRWGATPLQDAVSAGHQQIASIISGAGGIISGPFGKNHIFEAATKGDVKALSTLYDYGGLQVNIFSLFFWRIKAS